MLLKKITTITFIFLISLNSFSQSIKDSCVAIPLVGLHFSGQLALGDLTNRFGNSGSAGIPFIYKTSKNWLIGIEGNYFFGKKINEENHLSNLKNSEGTITANDGAPGRLRVNERGMNFYISFGKVLPILNSNKNINFSNRYKNTLDLSSRLIIYTGLSTGHLESLSINKPLLILVNTKNEPFKKKYHKYILQMKKIGILYDDPYELYKKIIQIYQNVDEWWNSKEIQIFRQAYIKKFAKINSNKINNAITLLNKLRARID